MNLRDTARPFITCTVKSGNRASFWHDNWTGLGSLLAIVGVLGPQVFGIPTDSRVCDTVKDGAWRVSNSRHPLLCLLRNCLPLLPPNVNSDEHDFYEWQLSPTESTTGFSSSKTWLRLNPPPPPVPWFTVVWFKEKVPKYSFITWLLLRERLAIRDRLRHWEMVVPSACLLCGVTDESMQHVFFNCSYSSELWTAAFVHSGINPPTNFSDFAS